MKYTQYFNILLLLKSFWDTDDINESRLGKLKEYLAAVKINSDTKLFIFDMDKVKLKSEDIEKKTSYIKEVFSDFIRTYDSIDFVFVNSDIRITGFITDKDFTDLTNVYVLSFIPHRHFFKTDKSHFEENKIFNLLNVTSIETAIELEKIIDIFIEKRIKKLLHIDKYECITDIETKEKHILKSTPVHTNKYVNLKPLIEDSGTLFEICFYIYRKIMQVYSQNTPPDFIVASSKNAVCIASGLSYFLKCADIIILNQVSPITAYNNYSNVEQIKHEARYAIVEDFFCMGTETKVVKGILWSKGVDVEENVVSFPIAATTVYSDSKYKDEKIYPLYKLEKEEEYFLFTNNCCPVCNEDFCKKCYHREKFKKI